MLHQHCKALALTHLGAWSHALGVNLVDTSRRSASYEYRIQKYAGRGFKTVFPGLSPLYAAAITESATPPLNGKLVFHRRKGLVCFKPRHEPDPESIAGDYDGWDVGFFPEVYLGVSNWRHAVKGEVDKICTWDMEHTLRSSAALLNQNLRYFVDKASNLTQCYTTLSARYKEYLGKHAKAYLLAELDDDTKAKEEVAEQVVKEVREIYKTADQQLTQGPRWRTENPGAQWTASFNPVMENPREFYSEELYRPCRIGVTDEVFLNIMRCKRFSPLWQAVPKDVLIIIARYTVEASYRDKLQIGKKNKKKKKNKPKLRTCAKCGTQQEKMAICAGCRSVHYCSPEHQKSHWKVHRKDCQPKQEKKAKDKK
jgi:hypothetical protein